MTGRFGIAVALHRTASRARRLLDRDAVERIGRYVIRCQAPGGGFQGRGEAADLYYTLFGLASVRALKQGLSSRKLAAYLDSQVMEDLDLVHLVSLLQCRRLLHPLGMPRRLRKRGAAALARFQTPDDGYAQEATGRQASAYGMYLGLMGEEVLGEKPRDPAAMAARACHLLHTCLNRADAGGDLNVLAAAALIVKTLCGQVDNRALEEAIKSCRGAHGAYRASPAVPLPDLLSTAVAAFCLRSVGLPLRGAEAMATAAYVNELWHDSGGFCAHAAADVPDCEYTFYALLAMGALEP